MKALLRKKIAVPPVTVEFRKALEKYAKDNGMGMATVLRREGIKLLKREKYM